MISFSENCISEIEENNVRHLTVYYDCSGQNKNYAVFLFMHYVVHTMKRLDSFKIVFPMRGHSYMECDKNMRLIKTKIIAEMPTDWLRMFETARQNPRPFKVICVEQYMIRDWTTYLNDYYTATCPFKTTAIREPVVQKKDDMIKHRISFYGAWSSASLNRSDGDLQDIQLYYPEQQHNGEN